MTDVALIVSLSKHGFYSHLGYFSSFFLFESLGTNEYIVINMTKT